MKVSKAIEILTDLQEIGFARTFSPQEANDAQKLGIEALKRVKSQVIHYPPLPSELLPGETEE